MDEIQNAVNQIDRLVRLFAPKFPYDVTTTVDANGNTTQDNWDLLAPAFVFTGVSCLMSIAVLAATEAPRREQDASVLLRRLYEHAVGFSWIAVDPALHAPRFLRDDYYHRLKTADELEAMGVRRMDPATRASFQAYVDAGKRWPNLLQQAEGADAHWTAKVPAHGRRADDPHKLCFVDMYTLIYRSGSTEAHPSAQSLDAWIHPGGGGGRFRIGMNPADNRNRYPYTLAPLVMGSWAMIVNRVLPGWPSDGEISACFEG